MTHRIYFSTFIEFYVEISPEGKAKTVITKKFTNPMQNKGIGAEKKLKQKKTQQIDTERGTETLL